MDDFSNLLEITYEDATKAVETGEYPSYITSVDEDRLDFLNDTYHNLLDQKINGVDYTQAQNNCRMIYNEFDISEVTLAYLFLMHLLY